ncbi:hypothetical protein GCK72_007608 [Caenorhabditis remanei]|uniref:Uncharacterized protein n=1 Tax=Caenorhabditis remanei TaxID=31234 RepID=A0A6A5HJI1_CAERE|nr:hypothetical protein GCK72_007608 [Caenorhabditis remanei]KAF1767649.1 hypothetical protein GCK72_007608 [Caenorhabditis remanei]
MSKRPGKSLASEINEEDKRMAIFFQLRGITDQANRALHCPVRDPVPCKFCKRFGHEMHQCGRVEQAEKLLHAASRIICVICTHHAANLSMQRAAQRSKTPPTTGENPSQQATA